MNFKQAVKIINERACWTIIDIDWEKKELKLEDFGDFKIMGAREAINFARWFTTERSRNYKKIVKKLGAKKNRRETRDLLNKGDYDSIPQNGRCADEDPWGWD